jgi:hypothetical protein
VGHPAVVLAVLAAWSGVTAVLCAAVLFGQTARTAPHRGRRRSPAARVGLFVSLSGPWLAVLLAAGIGTVTGAWLAAAAAGAVGIVLAALLGLVLAPH